MMHNGYNNLQDDCELTEHDSSFILLIMTNLVK